MGFYNIPTGRFIYASAGHNPPLIKRKNKYFEFLEIEPCFVLAWMEDAQYTEHEITLESGDVIYLYTDGVTEAMNQQGELFSEQRLAEILNKNRDVSPKKLLRAVKTEIDNFCDGAKQTDDITMLALQITEDREEVGIVEFSFPESDNPAKELNVEAKLENFVRVMDFIDSELERFGYPLTLKNEINIAVEEIFINIADYAYEPVSGNVNISISVTDKAIIKFEDTGKPYNPLEQKNPDLEKSPEEREIGGLGIFLVRNLMDTVEYTRFDGRNILVMTKNFPEA
jgi:sigma-B regulation protein RsbU (phosphoserine phosphatase)